jgi:hypothetical protein
MKLPNFKRLNKADFDQQLGDLVDTLSASLNIGIENLYTALNNRLSLADNFLCSVKDVQVTVNSSGTPIGTTTFTIDSKITNLKGLQIIKVDNVNTPTSYAPGAVSINGYTITSNGVQLLNVAGLSANTLYQLRIIAWG